MYKSDIKVAFKKYCETHKARGAWGKGVRLYCKEILEDMEDNEDYCNRKLFRKGALNGASDWSQYSWGGCSLIYDGEIAERLCSPSELKRSKYGERKPNKSEEWLDVQARALRQACFLLESLL